MGSAPTRDRDYHIGSNFWKFYVIRTGFTLGEPVSLVKVFRLFRLEWIVLVFRVWTQYIDLQYGIYWQGQRVCDAFFSHQHWPFLLFSNYYFSFPFTLSESIVGLQGWPHHLIFQPCLISSTNHILKWTFQNHILKWTVKDHLSHLGKNKKT